MSAWRNWHGRSQSPSKFGLNDLVEVCFRSRRTAIGTVDQMGRTLPNGDEIGWRNVNDKFDIISYRPATQPN